MAGKDIGEKQVGLSGRLEPKTVVGWILRRSDLE